MQNEHSLNTNQFNFIKAIPVIANLATLIVIIVTAVWFVAQIDKRVALLEFSNRNMETSIVSLEKRFDRLERGINKKYGMNDDV